MTHTYNITGMTCNGCVAKAKSELLKLGDITSADLQLAPPQARLSMTKHITVTTLQNALSKSGNYTITESGNGMVMKDSMTENNDKPKSWLQTYKPIILIAAYITIITLLINLVRGSFNLETWMQDFMAGFFLVFSFFKLLDVKGFAESYSTYDIIAKRWAGWGFIYAFIELGLGLAYLLRFNPLLVNSITFAVMSISIIGVLQSVLNKRKIKCACLGSVFNLPMSTITIIEDSLMIAMSGVMIILAI